MTYKMAVGRFAALMREQMRRNSFKAGWADLDVDTCFRRALNEMGELHVSISGKHPGRIKEEAADVANFLMMLVIAVERGE